MSPLSYKILGEATSNCQFMLLSACFKTWPQKYFVYLKVPSLPVLYHHVIQGSV